MSTCRLPVIRRATSVMTPRSMAAVAWRRERMWELISNRSRCSGESSGPKPRPISEVQESTAALRPTSVAVPTRIST
jgi:hypothetical protein